jgi:hypothetical protein
MGLRTRKKQYKQHKITELELILSILGIIFIIKVSDMILKSLEITGIYSIIISFIVPGALEIFVIILPYLKQKGILK